MNIEIEYIVILVDKARYKAYKQTAIMLVRKLMYAKRLINGDTSHMMDITEVRYWEGYAECALNSLIDWSKS